MVRSLVDWLHAQQEGSILAVTMATTINPPGRPLDAQELRAWRGMLRAHAALCKALDAELEAAHGLQLSSYEVLMYSPTPSRNGCACATWPRQSCSAAAG